MLRARTCLFDDLVRSQQNRGGYRKIERRGDLAVHNHLEFCRKLHREIARLRAAQDAIDIGGGATKGVYQVGSVGETRRRAAPSGAVADSLDKAKAAFRAAWERERPKA
jgi:hypothetical protein